MKTENQGIGVLTRNDELKESFTETISADLKYYYSNNRSFGAIDLWHLTKKQRTAVEMRRRFN